MANEDKGDIVLRIKPGTWLYTAIWEMVEYFGGTPQELIRHLLRVQYYRMREIKSGEQALDRGNNLPGKGQTSRGPKVYES